MTTRFGIKFDEDRRVEIDVPESSDTSADTPSLVVEQARALVQSEEARFSGARTRATTLLAVGGVIAGLGGNILAGLDGRQYPWPINVFGIEIPISLVLVCIFGAASIGLLIWSGIFAFAAKLTPLGRYIFSGYPEQDAGQAQTASVG